MERKEILINPNGTLIQRRVIESYLDAGILDGVITDRSSISTVDGRGIFYNEKTRRFAYVFERDHYHLKSLFAPVKNDMSACIPIFVSDVGSIPAEADRSKVEDIIHPYSIKWDCPDYIRFVYVLYIPADVVLKRADVVNMAEVYLTMVVTERGPEAKGRRYYLPPISNLNDNGNLCTGAPKQEIESFSYKDIADALFRSVDNGQHNSDWRYNVRFAPIRALFSYSTEDMKPIENSYDDVIDCLSKHLCHQNDRSITTALNMYYSMTKGGDEATQQDTGEAE